MGGDAPISRRCVVRYAGAATLGGIAGCNSGSSDDIDSPKGTDHGADHDTKATEDEHGEHETTHGDGHDEHETTHGDGHDHDGSLDGPSASTQVEMVSTDGEHHFEPHVVWIEEGGTVTWRLSSGSHSATAYHSTNDKPNRVPDGAQAWDSGVLFEAGATFEQTFETAGVYDYFCRPHEGVPMVGTVIVGAPDPGNQPGLGEPQDELPESAQSALADLNDRVTAALGDH